MSERVPERRRPLAKDQIVVRSAVRGLKKILFGKQRPSVPAQQEIPSIAEKPSEGFEVRAGMKAAVTPDGGISASMSIEVGPPRGRRVALSEEEQALMSAIEGVLFSSGDARTLGMIRVRRAVMAEELQARNDQDAARLAAIGIKPEDPKYRAYLLNAGNVPNLEGEELKKFLLATNPPNLRPESGSQGI